MVTKEFLEVCDYRNLEKAAEIARKNELYTAGRGEFFSNLEENIISLQNELIWRLYSPGTPIPAFKDIVVQIALLLALARNPDIVKDFYFFALLENSVQSPKAMTGSIGPFEVVYRRRGRRRKNLKP
jgi:hypothetical protein